MLLTLGFPDGKTLDYSSYAAMGGYTLETVSNR